MEFNLVTNIESCYFDIPSLLYYSHIPTSIVVFLIGFFVYWRNKRLLEANLLLLIAIFFSVWTIADVIIWIDPDSRVVMFLWSVINIFEVLVSLMTLYFSYVFLEKKDITRPFKIGAILLLAPLLFLAPTSLNVTGFDTVLCEAHQGPLLMYFYFVEGLLSITLLVYLLRKIFHAPREERKQVVLFSVGAVLFLLSFSGSNIIGSVTGHWEILQYGLFGVPVFSAFLAYLIVKYRAFEVRLIASQVLVAALVMLVGSQFFFVDTLETRILSALTFTLTVFFSTILLRSIAREAIRKEELQVMADQLAGANQELKRLDTAKSEFISIASHQLRTPLTAIKGYVSLILEGSYGKLSGQVEDILNRVYAANNQLIDLVENLLSISRLESGRMKYVFAPARIETLVREVVEMAQVIAKRKDIDLRLLLPPDRLPDIVMDEGKIREVISNLIDNSIKYTQAGSISVSVWQEGNNVKFSVKDTGIGVKPEDRDRLFSKFTRGKESEQIVVGGTGLGLYVGKTFIEKHGGRIWVESDGIGKGSEFFFEIPLSGPTDA